MAHFGHPGVAKTLEQLTSGYWWPLMKKDMLKDVKTVKCSKLTDSQIKHPYTLMKYQKGHCILLL